MDIKEMIRENVRNMQSYSSARDEFQGMADIWLDANENPNDTGLNRYPDPLQQKLKAELAALNQVGPDQLFLGNGSDEAIDLLFRAFCEPGKDMAYLFPPTYGMYKVSAQLNNVEIKTLPVTDEYDLPEPDELTSLFISGGLLFICSPNNPTGNTISHNRIKEIAACFKGIVVVDEAYIEFARTESAVELLKDLPNLVVLKTLSKAWGLAGIRIGMAIASTAITDVLNKIKPPYNINTLSQQKALDVLGRATEIKAQIDLIKAERKRLVAELSKLKQVLKVFPSEANFLLVQFKNAGETFQALLKKGIVVRDRTAYVENALRFSIGTGNQNNQLINVLKEIEK